MQDIIWKVKQLFRKLVPIALIAGLCFGGFTAYKRGWLGSKISNQIVAWTHKIPVFGSKFSPKVFNLTSNRSEGTRFSKRISKSTSHRGHHSRRHHKSRKHSRHRRSR